MLLIFERREKEKYFIYVGVGGMPIYMGYVKTQ